MDIKFAINHMVCPRFSFKEFCEGVVGMGITAIEFRNDLGANSIDSLEKAREAGKAAQDTGLEVLTINALYPFNVWNSERAEQAETMASYAEAAGARALVMCPLNDGTVSDSADERVAAVKEALKGLQPILKSHGIRGYVEVLGFTVSSLRFKKDAVRAIEELGFQEDFALVHDTFHHKGASEEDIYPGLTGLVHISGVEDPSIGFEEMQDSHRILVGPKDRLDNAAQIKQLAEQGYAGYFSFEPFSEPVWNLEDPLGAVKESIDYILGQLK